MTAYLPLLISFNGLLLELGSFTILVVRDTAMIELVRRLLIDFTVAGCEGLLGTSIGLRKITIGHILQLVTALTDESLLKIVLGLTFRSTPPHVSFSIRGHSTDQVSALRVNMSSAAGCNESAGRLVRNLKLTSLIIQVPHGLLLVPPHIFESSSV